jgi:hypothetical protein
VCVDWLVVVCFERIRCLRFCVVVDGLVAQPAWTALQLALVLEVGLDSSPYVAAAVGVRRHQSAAIHSPRGSRRASNPGISAWPSGSASADGSSDVGASHVPADLIGV